MQGESDHAGISISLGSLGSTEIGLTVLTGAGNIAKFFPGPEALVAGCELQFIREQEAFYATGSEAFDFRLFSPSTASSYASQSC